MSAEATNGSLLPKVKIPANVISSPFWTGRGQNRNRVCYVSAIPNSYEHWIGPARIDATIASIIATLNNAGIETTYCCSGRPCDHKKHKYNPPPSRRAYISIKNYFPPSLVAMLPAGIYLEDGRVISFEDSTPRVLVKRWYAIRKAVNRWYGIQQGY